MIATALTETLTPPNHWHLSHPAFSRLLNAISADSPSVYIVGGAVRDMLMGRRPGVTDLDLVVDDEAIAVARRAADRLGWAFYALDELRDVARLVLQPGQTTPLVCDVAGLRGNTIEADLFLRDFTINAMAVSYSAKGFGHVLDPHDGRGDLRRGLIRRVSPISLADDPIRLVRAVRFVAQFDFALDADTELQIRRLNTTLPLAGTERMRDELWKTLATPRTAQAIAQLYRLGLLSHMLPEIPATIYVTQSSPHVHDVYGHTLATIHAAQAVRDWALTGRPQPAPNGMLHLDALEHWRYRIKHHLMTPLAADRQAGDWLIWYALLHDIGKPTTRTVEHDEETDASRIRFIGHETIGADMAQHRLDQLRFSRYEAEAARTVINEHMRPHHLHQTFTGESISNRAAFRFFRDINGRLPGRETGVDVLLLALADRWATYDKEPPDWYHYVEHVNQLLAYHWSPERQSQRPLVDGHELMRRLDLEPGPQVGILLDRLMEAQAAGEIASTDDAIRLAAGWLEQAQR